LPRSRSDAGSKNATPNNNDSGTVPHRQNAHTERLSLPATKAEPLVQPKGSKPVARGSRFLSEMFVRMLELAQERIAASIAALKRVLDKSPPPSPPPAAPQIKPPPPPPTRKKPRDFKPS
jgi:hypothetical protein